VTSSLGQMEARSRKPGRDFSAFSVTRPRDALGQSLADALLITSDGVGVAVEIIPLSRPVDGQAASRFRARYTRLRDIDPRVQTGLLITRTGLTQTAMGILSCSSPVRHLQIAGPQDIGSLSDAIQQSLAQARRMRARETLEVLTPEVGDGGSG
jgi:hypothetical protein